MKKIPRQKMSMLHRLGLGFKVLLVAETVAIVGSYIVWRKMNKDREFRYKVYQITPTLLEYYYTMGEKLSGKSSRFQDYAAWGISQ